METPKLDFFLGKIKEVKDRVTYEVTVDVPGVGEDLTAYPYSRGEMDEPVAGNLVYVMSIDPTYHSVLLYLKAKENDFIGIRSNGKTVDITPNYITIGVYDTGTTHKDEEHPDCSKSYVKMDSSGNIDIMATGNLTINISGNADIKVDGNTKLTSPDVKITGGNLTTPNGGTVSATGNGGFNCLPTCLFTAAIHQGNTIAGT